MNKQVIFSYLNQKGGVGKSTILFHHAHYAIEKNQRVLVIDLDTQGNISTALLGDEYKSKHHGKMGSGWFLGKDKRDAPEVVKADSGIDVVFADEALLDVEDMELHEVLEAVTENIKVFDYDLILIDCPPTVGKRVIGALYVSDRVLSPIEPRKFSIDGLASLIETIIAVQADRPGLEFEGVIINRVNSRSPMQKKNIALIRESLGKQAFLNMLIEREPISEAIEVGEPVWKFSKGSARLAAKELIALFEEVEWRLN